MSFIVIMLELTLIHISFCRLMGMLDSLGGGGFVVHHTHHSEGKVCGDRRNIIYYLPLYNCLRYSVIGTYRLLLWVVLRNERILRDKRNLINVGFVFAFLCSLAVYISLLHFVIIISLLNSTRA